MSVSKVEPEKAKGHKLPPAKVAYNRRDLMLYANSVGAYDLKYTYENDPSFQAFPTYPVVLSLKGDSFDVVPFGVPKKKKDADALGGIPGVPKYDPNMILHGEQSVEILKPLPLEGEFELRTTIQGVYDKGKGMLMKQESLMVDKAGQAYVKMVSGVFIRGLGGFGGEKQPKEPTYSPPARSPDFVDEFKTSPQQALLYRLSGDYNPLHADPKVATKVGFPQPILHGLCTLGVAGASVVRKALGNDPARFKALRARFSSPVFPGETIVTEMWNEGGNIIFQCKAKERDLVVLSNAVVETTDARSKL